MVLHGLFAVWVGRCDKNIYTPKAIPLLSNGRFDQRCYKVVENFRSEVL